MNSTSDDILTKLERIAASLERIANKLDPPPPDKVGTAYVLVGEALGKGMVQLLKQEQK